MAYVTDFSKKPLPNLLGLINEANNLGLTEADVALRGLAPATPVEGSGLSYNTSVEIDVITNEVQDDYVAFTYTRVDVGVLFSLVVPAVREVDVPLNESGVPADTAVLWAEIQRKYHVNFDDENFDVALVSPGVISITAKATSVMYIGTFNLNIGSSLESRVQYTILDGFVVPA